MSDIFPRRNLPQEAEEWGRTVEDVYLDHETRLDVIEARNKSTNRTSAATAGDLARQLQALQDAYDALPRPFSGSTTPTGFGLSSGWNTIASVSVPPPGKVSMFAAANVDLKTPSQNVVTARFRLVYGSVTSPEVIGAFEYRESDSMWHNTGYLQFPWAGLDAGSDVLLQAFPDEPASWPGGTGSQAVLSVTGAISGS